MGDSEASAKEGEGNIFIVRVTGKTSKTIIVPDTICDFFNITFGDILKLNIQEIKKATERKKKK